MKTYALISEGFGHGFASLNFAVVKNLVPVAFSNKETEEAFAAEVNQIYNNLVAFAPNMIKANWENREMFLAKGWDVRADIIAGRISSDMWSAFANSRLAAQEEGLPMFDGLTGMSNILFVPQKLKSDGQCGISAEQQSLPLDTLSFLKNNRHQLVLGQHFHKVNDLATVKTLADDFNLYVPGMDEDVDVFGVRGVQHVKYWNLYQQLCGSVGIAGTHTWYLLTCCPWVPQIILFNKNCVEKWSEIEKAYQAAGYPIHCLGFDEHTDLQQFSKEIEALCESLF